MVLRILPTEKNRVEDSMKKLLRGEGDLNKPILKGSNGRGVAQGGKDVVTSNWSMHYGTSSIHGSGS